MEIQDAVCLFSSSGGLLFWRLRDDSLFVENAPFLQELRKHLLRAIPAPGKEGRENGGQNRLRSFGVQLSEVDLILVVLFDPATSGNISYLESLRRPRLCVHGVRHSYLPYRSCTGYTPIKIFFPLPLEPGVK